MQVVLRVIGGILIAGIGFLFVWKTEWFLKNFGTIPWAEAKLGLDGGTRLFYKLLGMLIITVGFLMMTGMFGGILLGTVGKLFLPPS